MKSWRHNLHLWLYFNASLLTITPKVMDCQDSEVTVLKISLQQQKA